MSVVAGLLCAFASALAVNWGYSRQHELVSGMPRFSLRRPLELIATLLRSRGWLITMAAEAIGWLFYLAALRLAAISLVQGVAASGIVVLALLSVGGEPGRLVRAERIAVLVGTAGLAMLALSLVDTTQSDRRPALVAVMLWLGALLAGAVALVRVRVSLARAAALGLAAGLLFGAGDICSKLVVQGGEWLAAVVPLLAFYGAGTTVLQAAFQYGGALTAAGLATLATNAIPIAAGFGVFGEQLPSAGKGTIQLAGFAALVAAAALLARMRAREPVAPSASRTRSVSHRPGEH